MTTPNNEPILHTETYQGRTITVVQCPRTQSEWSARAARIEVRLDERTHTFQGGSFPTEFVKRDVDGSGRRVWTFEPMSDALVAASLKKAIKKGRSWVDQDLADEAIRPSLEGCIAYIPRSDKRAYIGQPFQSVEDVQVGDRVWFFSRGNIRSGKVEKVGKTNVGVAYVTEKGGNITRKTLKPGQVGRTVEDAQQIAEVR